MVGAFTRAHLGKRVAFLAGGHFYGAPELVGAFDASVQVMVGDRRSAEALAARLRS